MMIIKTTKNLQKYPKMKKIVMVLKYSTKWKKFSNLKWNSKKCTKIPKSTKKLNSSKNKKI